MPFMVSRMAGWPVFRWWPAKRWACPIATRRRERLGALWVGARAARNEPTVCGSAGRESSPAAAHQAMKSCQAAR